MLKSQLSMMMIMIIMVIIIITIKRDVISAFTASSHHFHKYEVSTFLGRWQFCVGNRGVCVHYCVRTSTGST